jgi:hypothetical protein
LIVLLIINFTAEQMKYEVRLSGTILEYLTGFLNFPELSSIHWCLQLSVVPCTTENQEISNFYDDEIAVGF